MVLYDAIANRQTEPHPLFDIFGCEEWFIDFFNNAFGDPSSRIRNCDPYLRLVLCPCEIGLNGQLPPSFLGLHGVVSIGNEIEEYLFQLIRIPKDPW